MDYRSILEQAQHYVRSFFDTHINDRLIYHNRDHTEKVAAAARQIADHYQLNDTDFFIVNTAAWFHDIGYLTGNGPGHEERGAGMAASFLAGTGVQQGVIDAIRGCILSTKLPQRAEGLLQQIVCDADLFHLGTDEFGEINKLVRKEAEAMQGKKISKEEWRRGTIGFVESHQYYTDYCRSLLNEKQQENLDRQKRKEEEAQEELSRHGGHGEHSEQSGHGGHAGRGGHGGGAAGASGAGSKSGGGGKSAAARISGAAAGLDGSTSPGDPNPLDELLREHGVTDKEGEDGQGAEERAVAETERKSTEKTGTEKAGTKKKNKKNDPGRGIDTVFRITSNNNQRLSTQADSKAHILIQVNSIIISVLLSLLLRKIEDHTNLEIPAIILLSVNLVTIIFSILATRPQIPTGTFSKADLQQKKVNLLFFGNFYRMNLEEYAAGMLQMMDDKDFLYGSLIRDVYNQGIVLGRKYRWLRMSYNVFMYGLIASVLAFVIAALGYPGK
jgi:predicted metal-dependent HD superfamily phosphohydrolase